MKRILTMLLAVLLLLTGCGSTALPDKASEAEPEPIQLTLWTYPVGAWGNSSTVAGLLNDFRRDHPHINLRVEYLKYETGDALVENAIANGMAPDIVLEGPERLVANWGARGLMADLSDLMEQPQAQDIYSNIRDACQYSNGAYYAFPLCTITHCMAINYDLFREAGALQYLDEETRTWTTEGFIQAVNALAAYGVSDIGAVYCGGQGGDQGTRALVTNLYGGTFADPSHTRYTMDCPENQQALALLKSLPGFRFDPEMVGGTEVQAFCEGKLAMSFCWNAALEVQQVVNNPDWNFDVLPMAFPTSGGQPQLQSGIWGFGVFDNGDPERIAAAKEFISYMTGNEQQYRRAVLTSSDLPARQIPDIYVNDELMSEYSLFLSYAGDFYQITPGWSDTRTAWWTMLQKVGSGADIAAALLECENTANAAAGAS